MSDRKYGLYKRIMKRDPRAVDEIETLDEAKEIIKMIMMSNAHLHGDRYNSLTKEALDSLVEKVKNDKNDRIEPIYLPREYVESNYDELKHLIEIGAIGIIGLKKEE